MTTQANGHRKIISLKKAAAIATTYIRQPTSPSTYKCGCDSTYFLVSFHLFSLCLSSVWILWWAEITQFSPASAASTYSLLLLLFFLLSSFHIAANEWHWCKPAACYMYLDACNILSTYTDRLLSQRLLFVLDTIAVVAIIRYLCSVHIIHDVLE